MVMTVNIRLLFFIIFLTVFSAAKGQSVSYKVDSEAVFNARVSIQSVLAYVRSQPELFLQNKNSLRVREQREEVWQTWRIFLDRLLTLDAIGKRNELLFYQVEKSKKPQVFRLAYAAFLAEYRLAMDFINLVERDPSLHVILNEPVKDFGIEKGLYSRLKFRFLNILRGAEFVRLNTLYQFYGVDEALILTNGMEEDITAIWVAGQGTGPEQTFKNAFKVIKEIGFTVWFPLQKGVSEWMGDTKVWRVKKSLINDKQIEEMQKLLQPGDILLERREWYLSNVGLPGFWPHAAIYIGTDKERQKYFNTPEVREFYNTNGGGLNNHIKSFYPDAYKLSRAQDSSGHIPKLIEAISEGVSFTTLAHSVAADSVVILRPRLNKLEKAIAITTAFQYAGRPYDFNFDFLTDSSLVCTELVYKAYEPDKNTKGIRFPLTKILGRQVTTANDIARMFDSEDGTKEQQLSFVAFYDGWESKGKAIRSSLTAFKESWQRPKWHVLVQDLSDTHNENK